MKKRCARTESRGSPLVRGQRGKKEPAKETEGTAKEVVGGGGGEPGE